MTLVDLILTKEDVDYIEKEREERMSEDAGEAPWGLHLTLTGREIDKLGLQDSKFEVGDEMISEMKVKIVGVCCDQSENSNKKKRDVKLAVLAMSLSKKDIMENAADKLYR